MGFLKSGLWVFPFLILALSSLLPAEAQTTHHLSLSLEGKIDNGFWTPLPNQCPDPSKYQQLVPSGQAPVVHRPGLSKLVSDSVAITPTNLEPPQRLLMISKLIKILTGKQGQAPDIGIKKINERFYLLFLSHNYYLIDKTSDDAYYLRGSMVGIFQGEIVRIEQVTKAYGYQGISKDTWRFFFKYAVENGRLTNQPLMYVYDIDCTDGRLLGISKGSLCEDLDHDGVFELITRDEVDHYINWSWIYRWKNGCWVDSSAEFPDYYKTTVESDLKKLIGVRYVQNQKLLMEFIEAAKKGGPCCVSIP